MEISCQIWEQVDTDECQCLHRLHGSFVLKSPQRRLSLQLSCVREPNNCRRTHGEIARPNVNQALKCAPS